MNNVEQDIQLVQRAQQGDQEAFSVLVYRYQNELNQLARTLVGSADEAADITADAFVNAWRHIKSFRNDASFKTWIWRILINLSRSHLRRRYLQKKIFFWQTFTDPEEGQLAEAEWVDTSAEGDPERQAEQRNIRQIVRWTRTKLSPREQEVFALKYDKGLKISEIASLLSLSQNTVKVLLFRATKKMAAALKDYRK